MFRPLSHLKGLQLVTFGFSRKETGAKRTAMTKALWVSFRFFCDVHLWQPKNLRLMGYQIFQGLGLLATCLSRICFWVFKNTWIRLRVSKPYTVAMMESRHWLKIYIPYKGIMHHIKALSIPWHCKERWWWPHLIVV